MINKPTPSTELAPEQLTELGALKARFKSLLIAIMDETKKHNAKLDLSKVWVETDDLQTLYGQLTELKECLDSFRPVSAKTLENLQSTLDIQYTYESNRIEGNSLTLNETAQVIEKGLTIGGKPLVDHLEVVNHQEAIYYIRDLAKRNIELSEREVKNIHALVLKGIKDEDAGVYRQQPVFIVQSDNTKHEFPQAYILPKLVEDYFIFYNENKDTMHPVEMASHLHQRLVNIHPFIDGNGRTSRLVMNLYLFQNGYPITIIDSEMGKRQEYYKILSEYRGVAEGNSQPFELFIAQKVKESLFDYLTFFANDISDEAKDKGYLFFKRIEKIL